MVDLREGVDALKTSEKGKCFILRNIRIQCGNREFIGEKVAHILLLRITP